MPDASTNTTHTFTQDVKIIDVTFIPLCDLSIQAPDASKLPMPPVKWHKKNTHEPDNDLRLLDEATSEALDHYWAGRVKACQYAIFHIC